MIAFARNALPAPDPAHLQWCQNLVNTIKDGGFWGIPRSGLMFRVDRKNKALLLIDGDATNSDFTETRRVFAHIGWRVLDKTKNDTQQTG